MATPASWAIQQISDKFAGKVSNATALTPAAEPNAVHIALTMAPMDPVDRVDTRSAIEAHLNQMGQEQSMGIHFSVTF